jgi:predicted dehydrogenase
VKVAVIGLGYWGPNLVRNLHSTDAAPQVVACDVDEARVKAVIRQYPGTLGLTDYADVLSDPAVDAVVIATPVGTHASLSAMALDAGKSVLVEKPLATSEIDARGLVEQASKRRLLVMAGHTFLYSPPVQAVRRLIERGDIGDPLYVQSSRVNLGIHRSDVSVIWDLAPHDLAILQAWLGESPIQVAAHGRSTYGRGPTDVAFVDLQFPSGCVANLHLSWLAPTKIRRMTLVGTRRMVVYEDTKSDEPVKVYDKGVSVLPDPQDFGEYRLTYRTGDVVAPRVDPLEPLRAELEDFLGRVARGETPDEREDAAVSIVATLERAERSLAEQGLPVAV